MPLCLIAPSSSTETILGLCEKMRASARFGVMVLPRSWRRVTAGVLLVVSALAVAGMLAGTRYQKEDWRSAVARVCSDACPGD